MEWIRPKFKKIGISRLADVTKLDFIGVPTWQAIRPEAITLCVSQGKGCTHLQAKVSAAMESIEVACWEKYSPPVYWKSINQLPIENVISLAEIGDCIHYRVGDDALLPWAEMLDIISKKKFWLIHDLISVQRSSYYQKTPKWAYASTNGLSSGNSLREAQFHALLELIERDAECCATFIMMNNGIARPRIDINTITTGYIKEILSLVYKSGCQIEIFENPNEFGIYCYSAYLLDKSVYFYSNIGHGAHIDPNIAVSRAITEAVQSRITMISGSREDNFRADYRFIVDTGKNILETYEYEMSISNTIPIKQQSMQCQYSLSILLDQVIQRIQDAGFKIILCADLTDPDIQVPVVKMIVPGWCSYHRPLPQRICNYRIWREKQK